MRGSDDGEVLVGDVGVIVGRGDGPDGAPHCAVFVERLNIVYTFIAEDLAPAPAK